MRNLKKLLAVVLTVVMIASMMVPALAANTYDDEALKLQSIGMFAGEPADLKLEEGVTRIQGLAFAIRAAGVEADAFAMTDEEAAAILADYVDGADVPAWGVKYAAYAIKNSITVGVSATEKKFDALAPISGTSFLVFLMKAGMGYADVTTATVIEASVEAGILTAGQAASFGAKAALIRDDAAGILYGAAMNGVNADGTPLIEALIASGFVDADAALAAGFVVEVVPEDLAFLDASAPNLIQIVLELNGAEYDEDDVKAKANYEVSAAPRGATKKQDIEVDNVSLDGTTVTLTLKNPVANQTEGTVTINKKITGEKVEFDVDFFDVTIPKVEEVKVIGKDTVKVIFSEPMEALNSKRGEFDIDMGSKSYSIRSVTSVKNGYEANVEVHGSFKEGTLTVKVDKGIEDYAGFNVISKTFDVDVAVDDQAPVVTGYKDATREEVTLIFDEDVEFTTYKQENFYHTNTNSSNQVSTQPKIDGNEVTLDFSGSKLPEGSAYVYIKSGSIQDFWDNDNDTIKVKIDVVVDEEAPTVEETELKVNQLKVTFSEKLDKSSAEDLDNYTLKDKDGKKVSLRTATYNYDATDKEATVTIQLRSTIKEGVYSLKIVDVEDLAGNAMDDYSTDLEITDSTAPKFPAKAYVDTKTVNKEYEVYITFDEELAVDGKYDATDLYKYEIGGVNLGKANEDGDYNVTLKMEEGNKTVKLIIKDDDINVALNVGVDTVSVGRIADIAGNYTALSTTIPTDALAAITIEIKEAVATAKDTIEVTFKNNLSDFDVDDFIVEGGGTTYAIDSIDVVDDDEIIIIMDKDLAADTSAIKLKTITTAAAINTENSFGIKLKENQSIDIKDEIAPSVEELDDRNVEAFKPDAANASGTTDDVQSVWAEYKKSATSSIIYIKFDEDLQYVDGNNGLFKVNDGDNKVDSVTHTAGGLVTIKVEGEILKGDTIDITVVFDKAGNKTENISVRVEYAVFQDMT